MKRLLKLFRSATGPNLTRWYLIPQNNFFNICIHEIFKSDDDDIYHDHRANNVSLILSGTYVEYFYNDQFLRTRFSGDLIYRKAEKLHFIKLVNSYNDDSPQSVWTLFIEFRNRREWGFRRLEGEWIKHTEYK